MISFFHFFPPCPILLHLSLDAYKLIKQNNVTKVSTIYATFNSNNSFKTAEYKSANFVNIFPLYPISVTSHPMIIKLGIYDQTDQAVP